MKQIPQALPWLVIQSMDDGCIVYDGSRQKAHYLSAMTATVLSQCDGKSDRLVVERLLEEKYPNINGADVLSVCLEQLSQEYLLVVVASDEKQFESSRRSFLQTVAVASVPAILSVFLPPPAAAASSSCRNETGGSLCPLLTKTTLQTGSCLSCCNPALAGQSAGSGCTDACPTCTNCYCGQCVRCAGNNCCVGNCANAADIAEFATGYCERNRSTASFCVNNGVAFNCQRNCTQARIDACTLGASVYSCCEGCV